MIDRAAAWPLAAGAQEVGKNIIGIGGLLTFASLNYACWDLVLAFP
jgi:hypothetical protein